MYEDLKLNNLRDKIESPRLARLLIQLALLIEPYKKAAYVQYYLRENELNKEEVDNEIKRCYKESR